MQDAGVAVHRMADGAIDYGFYRAEAARLRVEAKQRFWGEIGRWRAKQLNALTLRLSGMGSGLVGAGRQHRSQIMRGG